MSKIEIKLIDTFKLAWNDEKSGGNKDGAFYNPINIPVNFHAIGSYGQANYNQPNGSVVVVKDLGSGAIAYPDDFILIYNDKKSKAKLAGSFWLPVAPEGYVAMGVYCSAGYDKPELNSIVCLRKDLVTTAEVGCLIWDDVKTKSTMAGSFWSLNMTVTGSIQTGVFCGAGSYEKEDASPLYGIKSSVVL